MTQGYVRESLSTIFNVFFLLVVLFFSHKALSLSASFGSLNERSALAGECEKVTFKNEETEKFKEKITSIGIMLHPESLKLGGRHYVPFVRLRNENISGVFPLIPDSSKENKYRMPCDFSKLKLFHMPESAYPTIEFLNLKVTELEKLNKEYLEFSHDKELRLQEQVITNQEVTVNTSEIISHYFNKLVIAELPMKWAGNPSYPLINDNKTVKSLGGLVSALIQYSELTKGTVGNIFKSLNQFDFYLYPHSIKENDKSTQKLAFRISNDSLCSHKFKGCADKVIANKSLQLEDRNNDEVNNKVIAEKQKKKPKNQEKVKPLYSIKLHQQERIKNSNFIKVFDTEYACIKDKPSDFSVKGFSQTETLQKLIRFSGVNSAKLPLNKWIYVTDSRIKLTKCTKGELRNGQLHFQLVQLRSDKPRKLIVWSPRMGFEQKIERVRASTVVRETLKSWIDSIYNKELLFPFTMVIIEPSGAAKVILESEELSYISLSDAKDVIESVDTAGYSDRALLDLTSVHTVIKSDFDYILYIVDSRNEAFKIEDVGVALSWKTKKKLTIANLGECQNWFEILGESDFECYSAAELGNGINRVLKSFL